MARPQKAQLSFNSQENVRSSSTAHGGRKGDKKQTKNRISTNQSNNQSINQSINQSNNQTIKQSIKLYFSLKSYSRAQSTLVIGETKDRIGIWRCWFLRRGENKSTRRKTSRSKDENQQQTQSTFDTGTGSRTRATLVGGECSHHCAIPAPHTVNILHYLDCYFPWYFRFTIGKKNSNYIRQQYESTVCIFLGGGAFCVSIFVVLPQQNASISLKIQCSVLQTVLTSYTS